MRKVALVFVSFVLCPFFAVHVYAIDADVIGGWTDLVIDSSCLAGYAGSDLRSEYESGASAAIVNITGAKNKNDQWRVDVRATYAADWPSAVRLSVKRGEGTFMHGGHITHPLSGGVVYREVSASDVPFFEGGGNWTGIPIQYRLSGISMSISPGIYSATVVFTVVDI